MANLWCAIILLIGAGNLYSMDLAVGQAVTVKYPEGVNLKVSRKGVVEFKQLDEGRWKVFPLRSGVVTVTLLKHGLEQDKKLYKVNKKKVLEEGLFRGPWRAFICGEKGIGCQVERSRVVGVSDSWRWFYQAKKKCQDRPPCIFNASLSKQSRLQFTEMLKRVYGGSARLEESGLIWLSHRCQKQSQAFEKIWKPFIVRSCYSSAPTFKMTSRVFWLRKGEAQNFGLNPWGVLGTNLLAPKKHEIHSFLARHHKQVVGQPELLLSIGKASKIRQGFDTIIPGKEGEPLVLKGGLDFNVKVIEELDDSLKLNLSVLIRQPGAGGQSYETGQIESQLWLPLGHSQVIGSIDANSKYLVLEENKILAQIPIISPLFKSRDEGSEEARLFVELKVERFDFHERG